MTIKEISRLAKVSPSTVSRYLNNGYVSAKNRKVIAKVIAETGYSPSSQAQMLRTKKSKFIGVIIPKINSSSISEMLAGISDVLAENNYRMLLACSDNIPHKEIYYLNHFKANLVDGIILMGTSFSLEHQKTMKNIKLPLVLLGQYLENYPCVYYDDYGAAKKLCTHLLEKAKNIAYLGVSPQDHAVGYERKRAFDEAMKASKAKLIVAQETGFKIADGYQALKKVVELIPQIDGLFCATDSIAYGAIKLINELKIKVPKEIKIVGMGDSEMSSILSPSLTSVKYYYYESGSEVAKLVLSEISEQRKTCVQLKLGCDLVIRESSQ